MEMGDESESTGKRLILDNGSHAIFSRVGGRMGGTRQCTCLLVNS